MPYARLEADKLPYINVITAAGRNVALKVAILPYTYLSKLIVTKYSPHQIMDRQLQYTQTKLYIHVLYRVVPIFYNP